MRVIVTLTPGGRKLPVELPENGTLRQVFSDPTIAKALADWNPGGQKYDVDVDGTPIPEASFAGTTLRAWSEIGVNKSVKGAFSLVPFITHAALVGTC
jgi:hypothetical protein